MPPSLAITSCILVGIPTTRFFRKSTSRVLWSQTSNMAAVHCSMLVHLWSFSCFFIQAHTVLIGLRSGELPGHLISRIWGRSAAELPYRVLCGTAQENDGEINLYRSASDKEFSSQNDEISSSLSFMHTLLRKKIWGLYLKQEKSYQHIKTSQYYPRPLYICVLYKKRLCVLDPFCWY